MDVYTVELIADIVDTPEIVILDVCGVYIDESTAEDECKRLNELLEDEVVDSESIEFRGFKVTRRPWYTVTEYKA